MSKSPKWEIICDKEDGISIVKVYANGTYIPSIHGLKITRTHPYEVEMDLRLVIRASDVMLDGVNVMLTELVSFGCNVEGDREVERLDLDELRDWVAAIPEGVKETLPPFSNRFHQPGVSDVDDKETSGE